MTARSESSRFYFSIAGITFLALGLRLHGLAAESAWHDEALTLLHLDAPSLVEYLRRAFEQDPYLRVSPLYFVVQFAWAQVFGPGEYAARCLSVALGVSGVPLLYAIGARCFGRRAGLYAAALLALSLVHTYYSQEVRFYALLFLLALAALFGLCAGLQGARWGWALNWLANGALLFTHAFAPLCFLAQGLILLVHFRRRLLPTTAWALAQCVWIAAFLLYVRWLGYAVGEEIGWYKGYAGGWREVLNLFVVFCGGRFSNRAPGGWMPGNISLDLLITVCIAMFAILPLAHCKRGTLPPLLWVTVPPAALYLVAQMWAPVFLYRYVLYSAAGVYLLAGAGLATIRNEKIRLPALSLLCFAMLYQQLALPRPMRPDFRAAAAAVGDTTDTRVFTLKHHVDLAFRYYSELPEAQILHYGGWDELKRDAIAAALAGQDVYILVHLWEKTAEAVAAAETGGLSAEAIPLRGLPPPDLLRISAR